MDPQKTVLYVITKATWGGAQRYVWDLMTNAKTYGYAPTLAYGERGLLAERAEAAGIPTYRIESMGRDISPFKEFAAKRELRDLFKKLKPDVVHLNSSKAGYTGAKAAHEAKVPRIIFTAHGWAFTEPRNFITRKLFEVLQRRTVTLSNATIAVSRFMAGKTEKWNLPKGRVVVIHHGIETPSFLSREEARTELSEVDSGLKDVATKTWVGTITELNSNKGIDIGIDGWKKAAPDAAWVVIGSGADRNKLEARAKGDLTIHFVGFIPDASKYLKAFDLFMLPSRTESFGYVVLEAALAGVPAIASDAGGTKELLDDPAGSVFISEDTKALTSLLQTRLSAASSLPEKGATLRAYAEKSFSFKRMLDETFKLYAP